MKNETENINKKIEEELEDLNRNFDDEDLYKNIQLIGVPKERIALLKEFHQKYCTVEEELETLKKLDRIIPLDKVKRLLSDIPKQSLLFYHIFLDFPQIDDNFLEIDKRKVLDKWINHTKVMLQDKENPVVKRISEYSFQIVKDLISSHVDSSYQNKFNEIKLFAENILKKAFTGIFNDLEKLANIKYKLKEESIKLKDRQGQFITDFINLVPPEYYLPLLQEMAFAGNYAIPKDEKFEEDWVKSFLQNPSKINDFADELSLLLSNNLFKIIDDREAFRNAIKLIYKNKFREIVKGITATRALDVTEEIRNEVRTLDENLSYVIYHILSQIKSGNREIVKFYKNNYFENWELWRNMENKIVVFILQQVPELKNMYLSPDITLRKKIGKLIKIKLFSKTRKGSIGIDTDCLKNELLNFNIQFGPIITQMIKTIEGKAPSPLKEYLVNEDYINEINANENEIKEIDIAMNSLRELKEKNLTTKKALIILKFAMYLTEYRDEVVDFYLNKYEFINQYISDPDNKSKIINVIVENFVGKEVYLYMLKLVWEIMPDKIKIAFSIGELGQEAIYLSLSFLREKFNLIQGIVKAMMKNPQFSQILTQNIDLASNTIAKMIKTNQLDKKITTEFVINDNNLKIIKKLLSTSME